MIPVNYFAICMERPKGVGPGVLHISHIYKDIASWLEYEYILHILKIMCR